MQNLATYFPSGLLIVFSVLLLLLSACKKDEIDTNSGPPPPAQTPHPFGYEKYFGGSERDYFNDMVLLPDSSLVATGYSVVNADTQLFLVRFDLEGQELFSQIYGGNGSDVGRQVIATDDGNILVCGTTTSFGNADQIYLLKADLNGNVLWSDDYGGTFDETGFSVTQSLDGGYAVGGHIDSSGSKQVDQYLMKVDANGAFQWHAHYGDSAIDQLTQVRQVAAIIFWGRRML